jgi:hypothetical protein
VVGNESRLEKLFAALLHALGTSPEARGPIPVVVQKDVTETGPMATVRIGPSARQLDAGAAARWVNAAVLLAADQGGEVMIEWNAAGGPAFEVQLPQNP